MNKTAIKNFAIWARNKLIADIKYRAGLIGITEKGIQNALPQSAAGTEFYDIGTTEPYAISGDQIHQRRRLVEVIRSKEADTNYATAYKYIMEEVAYTWFNRLIAVRFMEINDYLPSHVRVLSSENGKLEPDLVTNPFEAELEFSSTEEMQIIQLKQNNRIDELFRMVFIKQCNTLNEILPALFEKMNDYMELLLNISVVDQEGVVYHLVHDIPEEDFDIERGGQIEIIGWLYQYYNTEPKNDAFAKKGKISKEEVPAVTQLFTPDWIVRYMVENSLGRLYINYMLNEMDPNMDDRTHRAKQKQIADEMGWKYYLPDAEQTSNVRIQLNKNSSELYDRFGVEDIKIIDPCMGSGHILVYAFEVLMKIYENVGYSQRDAAKKILEKNIYGLDIDDRAFQMAYFAVVMKARQYNRRILTANTVCHLHSIKESNGITTAQMHDMGVTLSRDEYGRAVKQAMTLVEVFRDAKEYGSILDVPKLEWDLLRKFAVPRNNDDGQMRLDIHGEQEASRRLQEIINVAELMAQNYHVTITNPPYMAVSNANAKLNEYIRENYPDSKTDLFAVFIERCKHMTKKYGLQAMITQHSWMFLSSYEKLRNNISNTVICNMLHLGPRAFDEISGEVVQTTSFVIAKNKIDEYVGCYLRLLDGKNETEKEKRFFSSECVYYSNQKKYKNIPGMPIAYWVSDGFSSMFNHNLFSQYTISDGQNKTGNNAKFVREIWEVNNQKVGIGKKWLFYAKGGGFRRWYGNLTEVVNWSEEARAFYKKDKICRIIPEYLWYKVGITWSLISNNPSFRILPEDATFDVGGSSIFLKDDQDLFYYLALLNSKVFALVQQVMNPTINIQVKDIRVMPIVKMQYEKITGLAELASKLSKEDWDDFEVSWDYQSHPLTRGITQNNTIKTKYSIWEQECDTRFHKLKSCEEEINKLFVQMYGLQGEISPIIEDKDVSVCKAELQRDIKSLLSYAVGCMFGRYSLDQDGVVYAGGVWDMSPYKSFLPDEDNIIPITDEEYLEDDIISRLCEWLKAVYGEEKLEENLEFIAYALGNKGDTSREIIRHYFLNDFFKDHGQMFSVAGSGKRPIYWLFDSGKQNGFKALVYLHRYTPDTIGNLRVDYLHRMQRVYESEIIRMQDTIDHSTNSREVGSASKRQEKLRKQLKECRDYDEKIGHLALARIELDLDDGVKMNYRKLQTINGKLYEVLADSKNIMAKLK